MLTYLLSCICKNGWTGDRCERDINECEIGNGQCSHQCCNLVGSYKCSCPQGWILLDDERTCSDIDECQERNGGCAHQCHNVEGGYQCSCDVGYKLHNDQRSCLPVNRCARGKACLINDEDLLSTSFSDIILKCQRKIMAIALKSVLC